MDEGRVNGQLLKRFEQYCKETERLQKKLQDGHVPQGKRERAAYRLSDLQNRLIPTLIEEMQR